MDGDVTAAVTMSTCGVGDTLMEETILYFQTSTRQAYRETVASTKPSRVGPPAASGRLQFTGTRLGTYCVSLQDGQYSALEYSTPARLTAIKTTNFNINIDQPLPLSPYS